MPLLEFDCILGGVVHLNCEVHYRFGSVEPHTLKVSFNGASFDTEGIVIDYTDDFLPMSTYLTSYAQTLIDEVKNGSKTK